ncbi:hypothetical protein [Candidatus Symbiopectobacterium sp. NZEC135]|uniref:hypothetical protein n=1 Tax=Candidatus Symbiopectobacterium sp. NZEC135 TaxID=2820471 RepID=UPI002225D47F|nr:hypothetical protein [Candidatus Symbiopectobacterium sp. NZEC135]MCW2482605.1 hypothetical protein [Candidatus Symbiopectobacterium sp. NZEC135]
MTPFFDTNEMHETLKLNAKQIHSLEENTDFQRERNTHCITIINSMIKNPQQWDSLTPFNINNIGRFISIRLSDEKTSEEDIDSYFATLFRFLMELYFYQNRDLDYDLLVIKNFALNNRDAFGSEAQGQIFYTLNEMPFSLMRFKFNSDDIQHFIKAAQAEKSMSVLINGWDSKIALHITKVAELKTKLEEQENAYNFVGLYSGFDLLSRNKNKESKNAFWFTLSLGVLALFPLCLDVFLVYKGFVKVDSIYSLFTLVPAFTLTFIFIYYFKTSLSNYLKNIQTMRKK